MAPKGVLSMRVLGYVRVSTSEQASKGAGLQAQRQAIVAECERRGWHLIETIEDAGYSARDLRRAGIQEALRALERGEASALEVAVDTSTPSGEAMANMLATFAQFERRLISQRTKEALAIKKASGVRLGRPPTLPASVVRRIQRLRARGLSLRAIADELNRAGVPTAQGGARWY